MGNAPGCDRPRWRSGSCCLHPIHQGPRFSIVAKSPCIESTECPALKRVFCSIAPRMPRRVYVPAQRGEREDSYARVFVLSCILTASITDICQHSAGLHICDQNSCIVDSVPSQLFHVPGNKFIDSNLEIFTQGGNRHCVFS